MEPFRNDELIGQDFSSHIMSWSKIDLYCKVAFEQDLDTGKILPFVTFEVINYFLPEDERLICSTPDLDTAIYVYNDVVKNHEQ